MNGEKSFYDAIPGEMLVLLSLLLSTTLRALNNKHQSGLEGVTAVIINMSIGYFIMFLINLKLFTFKEVWWLAGFVGFMCTYILGGAETVGKDFQKKPIPMFFSFVKRVAKEYVPYAKEFLEFVKNKNKTNE